MEFEKYTERAKGFVQSAQALALRRGHQRLMPEHLLMVLLEDKEGLAANLIRAAGGDPRAAFCARSKPNSANCPGSRDRGLAKSICRPRSRGCSSRPRRSREGRRQLCHRRAAVAGADLGQERRQPAARSPPAALRRRAQRRNRGIAQGQKSRQRIGEEGYDALKKYARDLTEAARDGKLDPVIGRDEEIRRTIQVLSRRTKNNPVLIGEPGVGKTAIVEGSGPAHRQRRRAGGTKR